MNDSAKGLHLSVWLRSIIDENDWEVYAPGTVGFRDWVNPDGLKAEVRRTIGVGAALISFLLISKLSEWILGSGYLALWVRHIEEFVVLMVVFLYGIRLVFDIIKKEWLKDNGIKSIIVLAA